MIAKVNDVKVYAAIAIVVISWYTNVLFQYTIKNIISDSARFITRKTQPQARYFFSSTRIFSPGLFVLVYLIKKKRITASEK